MSFFDAFFDALFDVSGAWFADADTNTVPPGGGISKGVFDGVSARNVGGSKQKGCV
jgi:hypothetical protein